MNTKIKTITKHLTWLMPVLIIVTRILFASNVLKLSVQDQLNIETLFVSVFGGSVAHQIFGGGNGNTPAAA